jgi:hypothetical protein
LGHVSLSWGIFTFLLYINEKFTLIKPKGRIGVKLHCLTSALDGGGWSTEHIVSLTLENDKRSMQKHAGVNAAVKVRRKVTSSSVLMSK